MTKFMKHAYLRANTFNKILWNYDILGKIKTMSRLGESCYRNYLYFSKKVMFEFYRHIGKQNQPNPPGYLHFQNIVVQKWKFTF